MKKKVNHKIAWGQVSLHLFFVILTGKKQQIAIEIRMKKWYNTQNSAKYKNDLCRMEIQFRS